MLYISADKLRRAGTRLFAAAGAPDGIASAVATSMVENNLAGHDSHGAIRIPPYIARVKSGRIDPQATPSTARETPNTAIVSGNRGFGQIAARYAMGLAISKAKEHRLGAVGIVQCEHIGRLGEYSMMAAEAGLIGMVFASLGAGTDQAEAVPFGGARRALGTNPLSVAFPAGEVPPVLVDFATTMVAEGKVRVIAAEHEPVPEGWIVDAEGRPTTDPADFYAGGALLPFGGHKGFALGLLMDLFGAALTGALAFEPTDVGNGTFMMVIDPEAFRPRADFLAAVDKECRRIKAVPPAPGFAEVLLPGEPERRTRAQRLREGIPLAEETWLALVDLGRELGAHLG